MSNGTNALVGVGSHEPAQQLSSCLGFNLKHEVDCMVWIDRNPIVTRGVSHSGLVICIKMYFKAKEELWKFKYFTMQKHNLQKNPLKETEFLQDVITLQLISSFDTSQNIIFQKSSYKNRPIIT